MTEMTVSEIKKFMEGCEVQSLTYEGVVGVVNGEAYSYGEKIRVNWNTLYDEYAEQEVGDDYKWLMNQYPE